ncbi:MAG TPA: protein kinase [Gemmatimonadaceae bacterium]|nr:protein kinase [Gemmatimonadaceae bacterium]
MNTESLRDRLVQAAGDRYTIENELGRGGMAVVYAATDVRLRRAVAIKALPPDLAFRSDVRSRFLREAQMAAALSHPHIVPIYSVDEVDGLVFMVMGRVRGESLAQKLHRERRLDFGEARRILRETADALAHAHANGLIHRDVKPDNILLDEASGSVQVTDFGIARAIEGDARLTITGVAVGTPAYMSPEQARGDDDVDGRADIYALGVVGFQMVAGEPPFTAPNTPALLLKHVSEPPPPVASRRPDTPAALAYAIERALAKDRRARWPTAAAFREALADDAVAPSHQGAPVVRGGAAMLGPVGVVARVHVASRPNPPALPPYPTWRGGGDDERARWREAQQAWREKVRAQQRQWGDDLRAMRDARADARAAARDERRAVRGKGKNAPLSERIRRLQHHVISNVFVSGLLFIINLFSGGPPWFMIPVAGMMIGIAVHALAVWQDGATLGDLLRRPARLAALEDVTVRSGDPAEDVRDRARALVGSDVLGGPHGETVRRAADDERAIREIMRTLSAADRQQLPDVEATLSSLVERVASLARALHSLDAEVRPGQLSQLDAKLTDARALPEGTADRERRISLLERQRSSLGELAERRGTLADQLENASLVLQTMRLDLLRLRSAGIGSAAADVKSVTQEARALSTDIGRVLDAAAEVRKI